MGWAQRDEDNFESDAGPHIAAELAEKAAEAPKKIASISEAAEKEIDAKIERVKWKNLLIAFLAVEGFLFFTLANIRFVFWIFE